MNQNFSMLFYLKKQKKENHTILLPIYLRITVGGKRQVKPGQDSGTNEYKNEGDYTE